MGEETIVSGFLYPQKFLNFFTGQVAKIPPFKELDLPLPVFDGLDLKQEQQPCRFAKCTSSMDVLDLYESGEWTAAKTSAIFLSILHRTWTTLPSTPVRTTSTSISPPLRKRKLSERSNRWSHFYQRKI